MQEGVLEAGGWICGNVHPLAGGGLDAVVLPICARCTGIYFAFVAAFLAAKLFTKMRPHHGGVTTSGNNRLGFLVTFLMIAVAPIHALGFSTGPFAVAGDFLRLVSGVVTGTGMALLLAGDFRLGIGRALLAPVVASAFVTLAATTRSHLVFELIFWLTPVVVFAAWMTPIFMLLTSQGIRLSRCRARAQC